MVGTIYHFLFLSFFFFFFTFFFLGDGKEEEGNIWAQSNLWSGLKFKRSEMRNGQTFAICVIEVHFWQYEALENVSLYMQISFPPTRFIYDVRIPKYCKELFLITVNAFTSDHQIPMPPVPIYNWLAPITVQHCPHPSVNPATSHKSPPLNQSPRLRQLPPHRLNQLPQPQQHLSQKPPPLNQVSTTLDAFVEKL